MHSIHLRKSINILQYWKELDIVWEEKWCGGVERHHSVFSYEGEGLYVWMCVFIYEASWFCFVFRNVLMLRMVFYHFGINEFSGAIQKTHYIPLSICRHYSRRRWWHPTPVLLPGKSHAQRSLVGCSPWGHEELDTTERLHFHFSLSCIREGNGNPLQCSCLENPRDGGAWWAAVSGVAQSRTRLKQLGSSSSSSSRHYSCSHFWIHCS